MNNSKAKSFLILLIVLIVGMAIGFEISEILVKNRFEEMRAFKEPKGFVDIFEEIIKPDANQKTVIDSILLKYHNKMGNIAKQGMNKVSLIMDSMKVELKTVLTNEQSKRLEDEMSRMKRQPPPPNHGERMGPDMREPMPPPPGNGRPPDDHRPQSQGDRPPLEPR